MRRNAVVDFLEKGSEGNSVADALLEMEEIINASYDGLEEKVARIASRIIAGNKKLRVYDFDDTLVFSSGSVSVEKSDGEKIKMDSATFAHYTPEEGDKLNFGDFNDVSRPRVIKSVFDRFKKDIESGAKVAILTARPKGAATAVAKFLESMGIKDIEVKALASSNPFDKAKWIGDKVDEGYDDVEFTDDSSKNVAAVETLKQTKKLKLKLFNPPKPKENDFDGKPIDKFSSRIVLQRRL